MTVRCDGGSWMFVIDLPRGEDGKRRQMRRRGLRQLRHRYTVLPC
jgi:hypothetical protein